MSAKGAKSKMRTMSDKVKINAELDTVKRKHNILTRVLQPFEAPTFNLYYYYYFNAHQVYMALGLKY